LVAHGLLSLGLQTLPLDAATALANRQAATVWLHSVASLLNESIEAISKIRVGLCQQAFEDNLALRSLRDMWFIVTASDDPTLDKLEKQAARNRRYRSLDDQRQTIGCCIPTICLTGLG